MHCKGWTSRFRFPLPATRGALPFPHVFTGNQRLATCDLDAVRQRRYPDAQSADGEEEEVCGRRVTVVSAGNSKDGWIRGSSGMAAGGGSQC